MKPQSPVNIWPLNIDNLIKEQGLIEVTSPLIWEPSSTNLHPDGLFSEGIFGQIGTAERISRCGFMSLNTAILAPVIYKNVIDLKPIYSEIMSGKIYAYLDKKSGELIPCDKEKVGSDTGFSFFLSCFDSLKFPKTESHTRQMKILAIERAKSIGAAVVKRLLILPAGLRELKVENGRVAVEEINSIYKYILALASEVKNSDDSPQLNRIYDGVRYNIQLKVYELFSVHKEFLSGKAGFAQRKYARRALAYGTRNVISGAELKGTSVSDPTYQKHDETIAPLFQLAKGFQPLVIHNLRALFYSQIFTQSSTRVIGIDTKTYNTEYIDVSNSEVNNALSSEGMEDLISMFKNVHMREKPVIIRDVNDKFYYLFLVYDTGESVYLFRSVEDFTTFMKDNHNVDVDRKYIRPLTYMEMLYLATFRATAGKFMTFTRYPAIEIGSIYPTRIKVGTTIPSRKVRFMSQYDEKEIELPMYPILGKPHLDSTIIHPGQTKGLGADYDGDTGSLNSVMSVEGTAECEAYLNSTKSLVTPDGKFIKSLQTDLTGLTFFNLSRDPQK